MAQMIRRVGKMATRAWDFSEYAAIEPAVRPMLRLVESTPAGKPMPPAWLVAPPFRAEPAVSVREPQAAYRPTPASPEEGPYRTIREVPRAGG